MYLPYDSRPRRAPPGPGLPAARALGLRGDPADDYPLLLHHTYFDLYRKQVTKQADLVLALFVRSRSFTAEQKRRDFDYYEGVTVRDSSLSACTQAIVAAEVGHLELAHRYLAEAAFMDLHDLEHNIRDGLHIASLAGAAWAVIAGLGGMRDDGAQITFAPRLPAAHRTRRLPGRLRGQHAARRDHARRGALQLQTRRPGPAFAHWDKTVRLSAGGTVTAPIPPLEPLPEPAQPPHRAPLPLGEQDGD